MMKCAESLKLCAPLIADRVGLGAARSPSSLCSPLSCLALALALAPSPPAADADADAADAGAAAEKKRQF